MREKLLLMKNKDFAYNCLEILIKAGRKEDVEKLTNEHFCKRNFDMNFPVLSEVPLHGEIPERDFRDHCLNRRYYPQPIVAFGKRYIVCNDWYYNNKKNPRDTRTDFVNWILK